MTEQQFKMITYCILVHILNFFAVSTLDTCTGKMLVG